ncbi:hypothetical protein Hbl1158_00945 [Halobaculum sp. CBA1158]|uniref:hypothetical protein n=1 Tax=Halobaculum sp. CBA1158 TaxID=2904243 RepID=UPI001F17FE13|nr:hypothetical protein [Halobaculum sp. CBA1158]UIO99968.1 hypothetical protein Hbl1158_00945 [Halobaculum sp. CBA1158]
MSGADIEFRFESTDDEERFVREYLPDAWTRFETADYWETGWFWRYGGFAEYDSGPDGGLVRLVLEGDPDGIVDAESPRWDAFEGLDSWELRRYEETDEGYDSLLAQQRDAKGRVGGEREYLLKPLAARFVLDYYRTFEESLPAVGEAADENPAGVGFWAHLHFAMIQAGYDWYDETEACLKGLRNRLKSLASYRGGDAARREYERLREDWQAYGDELETWIAEHPTGEASEP